MPKVHLLKREGMMFCGARIDQNNTIRSVFPAFKHTIPTNDCCSECAKMYKISQTETPKAVRMVKRREPAQEKDYGRR